MMLSMPSPQDIIIPKPTVPQLPSSNERFPKTMENGAACLHPMRQRHVLLLSGCLLTALQTVPVAKAQGIADQNLIVLLDTGACQQCRLQDVDLVHADLRDAQLTGALLQRSNLARARLDGADLRGSNLSFASLLGASLRGADLRGANLHGADLRQADLSGALLDAGALAGSHWKGSIGAGAEANTYAALHNAGVEALQLEQMQDAERYFDQALIKQPDAAITWMARGIARSQQAKDTAASQDIRYAAELFEQQGDTATAEQLREQLNKIPTQQQARSGNGYGSDLLKAAGGLFQQLAPLAVKLFAPMAF